MKKLLLLSLTLFSVALSAVCQKAHAEEPEIRQAEAVERTERRPGFFERLFKRRRGEQQKEPEAASTPPTKKAIATEASEIEETPRPSKRRTPKPTATPIPSDDQGESTQPGLKPSPSAGPGARPATALPGGESETLASNAEPPEPEPESKPESTPKIEDQPDASNLIQPIPFVSTSGPEKSLATPVPDLLDPEYVKRMNERYKELRSEAQADKEVAALRDKADGTFQPSERAKALKVYYEALFRKMREIDPSLNDRIDGREKATMRRIEALAPVGE